MCVNAEWFVGDVGVGEGNADGVSVDIGYPAHHSIKGEFKFALPSASSNQYCSSVFSGWSSLLPAMIAAFSPPIEVPAIISILILLFASALKTPQPKALENLHLEVLTHSQWC